MTDAIDSKVKHLKHTEKVAKKHEALEGKKALLQMWEAKVDSNTYDHDYVVELRRKVRNLNVQLMAMRPVEFDE